MAKAYECDHCGKLYKKYSDVLPISPDKTIRAIKVTVYTHDLPKKADVCPACRAQFALELVNYYRKSDLSTKGETPDV